MHGLCQVASTLGTSLAFNSFEPMARAICLKKGQFAFFGFKVKRLRTTPRHCNDAARDGRLYTVYPPGANLKDRKPHGSSCGFLSFNWLTSRSSSSCVLSFLAALDFDQARRPDMIDGEVPASSQAVTTGIALDEFILPFHFLRVWRDHAFIHDTEAFL
jgi:hypothetical protein